MIYFQNDYAEGAHETILSKLLETNEVQTPGYGTDEFTSRAKELIKQACASPEADVHFLTGGTQTNTTVISAMLRPHQGVISADSGHIAVHEAGAIESTGHKIITLASDDGKLTHEQVDAAITDHFNDPTHEHIVQPGLVYISQPTELGTMYSKTELTQLKKVCDKHDVPLFIDGARLGYALAAKESDLELADVAALCDVFYIGGTKVGALFGEAVVITNKKWQKDFRSIIKQRGAMLAKGRLLGIQFETLFTDNLYGRLSSHAIEMADKLKQAFLDIGISFKYEPSTNQLFPIVPNQLIEQLSSRFAFYQWEKYDNEHTVCRFITSWATKEEQIQALKEDLTTHQWVQ
ncbi:low-specificity L-threonine aldolase [Bacillus sp. JCM 19046]|nr:low-specificity L-threonine aldolase [Bacillus sp. JCM 19045]GAF18828.1 low-specificity L-threonine aldolase [Bacillus sp. JCM 19046]